MGLGLGPRDGSLLRIVIELHHCASREETPPAVCTGTSNN